jgi:hypothetical protein
VGAPCYSACMGPRRDSAAVKPPSSEPLSPGLALAAYLDGLTPAELADLDALAAADRTYGEDVMRERADLDAGLHRTQR